MRRFFVALVFVGFALSEIALSQRFGGRGGRSYADRSEFPVWENEPEFEEDVFTFARVRYVPHGRRGWDGDYPEADLNISYRLQELTSMKVNPNPVVVELTDPDLKDYPFLFLIAPWSVNFTDAEAKALGLFAERRVFDGRRVLGASALGALLLSNQASFAGVRAG